LVATRKRVKVAGVAEVVVNVKVDFIDPQMAASPLSIEK